MRRLGCAIFLGQLVNQYLYPPQLDILQAAASVLPTGFIPSMSLAGYKSF